MGKHPTFSDPRLEAQFSRQGYVVLPMLDRAAIPGILLSFQQLRPSDGYQGMQETALMQQSFHVTFFDRDLDYRRQVFEYVQALFQIWMERHLQAHRMVQGNVFLKPPGKGFVFPHQNLTITDEGTYRSVSLWCPLQDTDAHNGTLFVIPGSQNGFMRYRNTQVEWPLWEAFMPEGKATPYLKALAVKAGEVVVLDDRLIHVTPDNHSEAPRWVIHGLCLPGVAPLRYFDVQGDWVVEYAVGEDFWQYYAPGTQPEGLERVGVRAYEEPRFTEEGLIERLEALEGEVNTRDSV
jgi:hypothetical protein